ncbi:unnamed protein product [Brassica oleracea var. botrytis]|uniref:Uncharacterized protein n=2 Tax=Brassica TaxID=3705 RepID=A0A0D3AHK5_BRAOL|nr:unnamed protein product [Brassica napus]CDY44347.1 BnaC02g03300D [Brassica napus]
MTEAQSSISPSPKPETKTFTVVTPDSSRLFTECIFKRALRLGVLSRLHEQ